MGNTANVNPSILDSQIETQTYKIEEAKQDFLTKLISWWQTKIGVITGFDASTSLKLCGALATEAGVASSTEICSPWLVPNTPYFDHVIDSTCPIEQNKSDQNQTNLDRDWETNFS